MAYDGAQHVRQKEIIEREVHQETHQPWNTAEVAKKLKKSLTSSTKTQTKMTLRRKAVKNNRLNKPNKLSVKIINEEAVMPFVPRKVFRVLSLLRHDRFMKLVTRFFKPIERVSAWNFEAKLKKNNKTG